MSRVLVADDDALIRELLSNVLREQGLTVITASDGEEALEAIDAQLPDLLLLDLNMPRMDGFTLLDVLRTEPGTWGLQVIVLTARSSQDVLAQALEAGADDFIGKPFHLGEVVARVRAHLRIAAQARQLDRQRRDGHVLLDISHRLGSRLDIQSILHDVTEMVAEVLEADRCSIVMLDGDAVRVVATSDDATLTDRPIDLANYPEVARVIETGEPLVLQDVQRDPLLRPVKAWLEEGAEVRSSALFPILERDRCMGVLFVRSAEPWTEFGEREKQLGQIVANATAVAMSNARLFAELRAESARGWDAKSRVEQQLHAVERFELFFENSADSIFITGEEGTVRFMNRQAEALVDVPREQVVGQPFSALVKESARSRAHGLLLRARGREYGDRVDLSMASGRLVAATSAPVPGEQAFIITVRDVTEERSTARALQETRDFLQRLVDASPNAIVATDRDGRIRVFNKSANLLFGRASVDVVGLLRVDALFPDGADEIREQLRGAEHGGPGRLEPGIARHVLGLDGALVPVHLSAAVVGGDEAGALAAVFVFEDQRARLEMEDQLQRTRERLKESERMALLAELAGATAHELNQPLTSVMGYAQLIKRRFTDPEDPLFRAVDTIHRQSQRMADIVRQVGRITRYETKQYVGGTRIIDLDRAAKTADEPYED
ncbi:MAG: response regulator [Myxococcales bacterium]|nr:response regulator [Myxococcales bacterium]